MLSPSSAATFLALSIILTLFAAGCEAVIHISSLCNKPEWAGVRAGLEEHQEVISTAYKALVQRKVVDAQPGSPGLFSSMFREQDYDTVVYNLKVMSSIGFSAKSNTFLWCGEDNVIRFEPGADQKTSMDAQWEMMWRGPKDLTKEHAIAFDEIGPKSLPRQSPCNKKVNKLAYAVNGFKYSDELDFSKQTHLVLCRKPDPSLVDTRSYGDILKDGLKGSFPTLMQLEPVARTLIHELAHHAEVSGFGARTIQDGPNQDTYSHQGCMKLKKEQPEWAVKTAECYAILITGLYLQFKIKKKGVFKTSPKFTWVTGGVAVDLKDFKDGTLQYQPVYKDMFLDPSKEWPPNPPVQPRHATIIEESVFGRRSERQSAIAEIGAGWPILDD